MSGDIAARTLQDRFEQIRASELERLKKKKIGSVSPAQRHDVEKIAAEIIDRLASRLGASLRSNDEPRLVDAMVHLFRLEPLAE